MAKRFLTHLDLSGNQLLNATFEKLAADPTTGNFEGRMYYNTADEVVRLYDGENWVGLGAIKGIEGTENQITVSTSADEVVTLSLANPINVNTTGSAAKLTTARTISLGGDLSGSASFDGSENITISALVESDSAVTSITGTANEIDVSASVGAVTISLPETIYVDVEGDLTGNADTATALETGRVISLGGDLSGSATFDGTENITITANIESDSVELGTDTTGNYVESVSASGDGISVTGSGEGASVTIENTGVTSLSGTENEIEVSASSGSVTIGLPDSVTVGEDLTVGKDLVVEGDFTVRGTTTFIDTEDLHVKDNLITLNFGLSASVEPTLNAGIEVARGSEENVSLIWNETLDTWQATRDGSTYADVLLSGDAVPTSDITDFQEEVEDVVGGMVQGSTSIDVTYNDNGASAGTLTVDTILKSSDSYLTSSSGLAVDVDSLETQLVIDSFTRKASANVGNGTNTSFALIHSLNTRDVQVQVYDNSTYDTVEADVVRTDADTVTVSFSVAPSSNAYRVVVIG
jgi:hypothetical protein